MTAKQKPAAKKAAAKPAAKKTAAPKSKGGAPKGNQNAKGNKGGGAPTLYLAKYAGMAAKACKVGFTDMELADMFGVSVRTINAWKVAHVEFASALKAGKTEADDRVERSLFARANGYEHDEVDIRVVGQEIVQTPIRKFYPPDTTAAIFWLKNRRQAEWRDKIDHTLGNPDGSALTVVVKNYSDVKPE